MHENNWNAKSKVKEKLFKLIQAHLECGLESKLNADAAKWTWKSVPHGDGWKWDYKKFPIKYSYASIGDDDDDKSYLDDIKDGIELIS